MSQIKKFEDIQAWQKARELTNEIYYITNEGQYSKDYVLKDQTRRSAISIMLNIEEGFARQSDKEFRKYLFIAHASAAEVQSALYIAGDQNYIIPHQFETLHADVDELSKMITGFIKYLGG